MITIDAYREIMITRDALIDRAEALRGAKMPNDLEAAFRRNVAAERSALTALSASPLATVAEVATAADILARLIEEEVLDDCQPALARRIATDIARLAPYRC